MSASVDAKSSSSMQTCFKCQIKKKSWNHCWRLEPKLNQKPYPHCLKGDDWEPRRLRTWLRMKAENLSKMKTKHGLLFILLLFVFLLCSGEFFAQTPLSSLSYEIMNLVNVAVFVHIFLTYWWIKLWNNWCELIARNTIYIY